MKFGTAIDVFDQAFLSLQIRKHVQRFRLTKSTRDRGDIPHAQTVLAVGERGIAPINLSDGFTVIPLKHTTKNPDGSEKMCRISGTTGSKTSLKPAILACCK